MSFKVSQSVFNEAVKELIDSLGLSPEEATKEIIEQFRLQGVDMSVLSTDYFSESDIAEMTKLCEDLASKTTVQEVMDQLNVLQNECSKGMNHKIELGKVGACDSILSVYHKWDNFDVQICCLKTLLTLMTKQPDLLNDDGRQLIVANLNKETDPEILKFMLKLCKECCVMHEMNRQSLVDLKIVDKLKDLLEKSNNSDILRGVLGVCRALLLDDDIRVEFGKAHEHARIIAGETLQLLIALLKRFNSDENLISDLMLTLSALLVRSEFCKSVDEAGGLDLIHDVMTRFVESDKINRQCFKLMKAMAGDDKTKINLVRKGLAPVIYTSLTHHFTKAETAAAGLGCVAALCLRFPDNSKAFFDAGFPDIIVEIMKKHPNDKSVQRVASWTIRNMVCRSRYQSQFFLDLGAEDLLKQNLRRFNKEIEYDTKAALRDLGCNVELKEEWTGKGGKLSSDANKIN